MTSELPPIPDVLLAPLLDTAAATLRALAPTELPQQLRALVAFDTRGLARGPARRQLQRAFDDDESFHAVVVDVFLARDDVAAVRETWSAADALQMVDAAAGDLSLPLLASMLYAARPDGWSFGLGAACAVAAHAATARALAEEARTRAAGLAAAAEAQRRAEVARGTAEEQRDRFEQELRAERRSRRDREVAAELALDQARGRTATAEERLARTRATLEAAESRARRETERAARAERELADARRVETRAADDRVLRAAAADARALAAKLDDLASPRAGGATSASGRVRSPEPTNEWRDEPGRDPEAAPRPRPRRARPSCPPGLVTNTPAALDAMLRTRGVVLVVDGYNVTKTAWGDAALEEQRERLIAALAELHLRIRCEVVVVFDGADVRIVPGPRRPGVRVLFSAPGETADDVVVREAGAPPGTVPVVVASSDADVQSRSEAVGAAVVASSVLLSVLRR